MLLSLSLFLAVLPFKLAAAQSPCPPFPSPLPSASSLPSQSTLPDPFQYFTLKTRISSPAEWYTCRQPEIKRLLQEYQYGFYPDHSLETVKATRNGNTLNISITAGGKTGQFTATLSLPSGASASKKVPVMLAIGGVTNSVYNNAGIAVATIDYLNVAPDGTGKTGAFWSIYNGRDIGALTAWAWGVHRTLDAIELLVPEIDPTRTASIGCSRLGKAALAAGLFDSRILITVPMSSGIQGLGPYRYWQLSGQGENLENSKQGAPWWTSSVLSGFLNNSERLPYDSHFIAAAIAPRYMVIDEGQSDPYVNAKGTATVVYPAARVLYKWLGVEERIGMAIRTGGHCDPSGHANVLPFLQKVFFNTTISRDYNNLSPWSAVTTAYPWASNLPTGTATSIPSPTPSTTPIPSDTTLSPTPSDTITSISTTTTPTTSSTPTTTPISTNTTILPPANCHPKWAQCGGVSWTGSTCCVSGSTCMKSNEWFSQCL
ncbi:hypothetical protein BDQ12DRAFT_639141 [Crucibulum laeve]|uniref:(4-O-methyl)-D-glucuronate--lignin esterase n=1 Tax=Crucibulum laeve TaxID=68775 RepID=A0A5C3LIV6_9AGAR|nr:hypothetical protein BDQ12DRAFT_639141 [Crucibulum laeve]